MNTSVGAIAKVNCVFLFHLNNSKKICLLIYSIAFTMIAESCWAFCGERKGTLKITMSQSKEVACITKIIISDFS